MNNMNKEKKIRKNVTNYDENVTSRFVSFYELYYTIIARFAPF